MNFVLKSKLPRLASGYYQGNSVVMWTHTLEHRSKGWLDEKFHFHFRELLLHAADRYALACPCYVLMPDHWHLVWMGLTDASDQHLATAFLRKHLRPLLGPARLQDRAHDHVLREDERKRQGFQSMCGYVLQNPARAGLCPDWRQWAHLGAVVIGYPAMDPREAGFWPDYWKIYSRVIDPASIPKSLCSRTGLHDSVVARPGRTGI